MRAAGVREFGGQVEVFDLPDPRGPGPDEAVVEVAAAGVGNWDELVRTGEWKVGREAPMALGVEAAGRVITVGSEVTGLKPGDEVLGHPLQLREQGCWAERVVVDAGLLVRKPPNVSWEVAGAFPVPALTAEQVLSESLELAEGDTVLVHGAGGTTGGLIVQLAALRGARVIATAGPSSAARAAEAGAAEVLDYHDSRWPELARALTGGVGVDAAVNAARGGSPHAVLAVRDSGRMATITGDPPESIRGISVSNVYVRPDAAQLEELCTLLGDGRLRLSVGAALPLADAATALERAMAGANGGPVVLLM